MSTVSDAKDFTPTLTLPLKGEGILPNRESPVLTQITPRNRLLWREAPGFRLTGNTSAPVLYDDGLKGIVIPQQQRRK